MSSDESAQNLSEEAYEKQIFKSTWSDLKDHAQRDGIIIVSPKIKLALASKAVVENNADLVSSWINNKELGKPEQEQLDAWNQEPSKPFLLFIAQPYVLIQEIQFQ